jgi:hypothetical protein
VEETRILNCEIRKIARRAGLDLSLHQGFHKYSPQEQIRAVLHVVATFPPMSKDDARFHINKAITIYAGEMRRRHKKKNDSDCQTEKKDS